MIVRRRFLAAFVPAALLALSAPAPTFAQAPPAASPPPVETPAPGAATGFTAAATVPGFESSIRGSVTRAT